MHGHVKTAFSLESVEVFVIPLNGVGVATLGGFGMGSGTAVVAGGSVRLAGSARLAAGP